MRLYKLAAAVAAMVIATAAAGCSSSSGGSDGASASGTWKLGSPLTCSGPLASSAGPYCDAVKAWAKSVNASGGINGHKIDLILKDDAGNPATGQRNVRELVEKDHVIALIGLPPAYTFAAYLKAKNVPAIGFIANSDYRNPAFFGVGMNPFAGVFSVTRETSRVGTKNFGFAYCAESAGCAQSLPIIQLAATSAGQTTTAVKISSSAADYTAPCLQMKNAGVQSVLIGAASDVVLRVFDSCVAQGLKARVAVLAQSIQPAADWLKDKNTEGMIAVSGFAPWYDSSIPGIKTYLDGMAKYAPGAASGAAASAAWSLGEVFKGAAQAAHLGDNPTPAQVIAALHGLHGYTADGLLPPLSFPQGAEQNLASSNCYFTITVKGGAFATANGGKPACVDQQKLAPLEKLLPAS
ncbi:ABC transporter substrate-binding protein [Frankia sp. AgKG'84/4]|uniref:ABC transporter substrate-binding protein n=1 Tax=Frankia sp. AgKG'84/4 TaxID=573490 RepID=UPI0020108536|nr:ABC transporter substrate-binding protein [Frankia sp. AgKG'84/4]MCL9793060.1 ABC transporter substrate-binding protein [Frankia sp. AgKG'84/4]